MIRIPEPLHRFGQGPWPAVWLIVGVVVGLWVFVLPPVAEARRLDERTTLERLLAESQAGAASLAPAERFRRDALLAWWRDTLPTRVQDRTLDAAAAAIQQSIVQRCVESGATVTRIEATQRSETISEDPPARLLVFTVRIEAPRMRALVDALAALEARDPWVRIGNVVLQRSAYRVQPGVQVETTLYAWVEGRSGG